MVEVRQGMAGMALRGKSGLGQVWQAWCVMDWYGEVGRGRQGTLGFGAIWTGLAG